MTVSHLYEKGKQKIRPRGYTPEALGNSYELSGLSVLDFLTGGKVFGRLVVQVGDQFLRGGWHGNGTFEDDILGVNVFFIEGSIGFVVGAYRGASQRDPGEEAAGAGVGKNLRAQGDVGGGFGVATFGACGGRGICAELDLRAQDGIGATAVHDQEDEVGGLAADLQTDAGAFEGHHRGGAPWSVEMLAAAAGHGSAAVAAATNECSLQHRGIDDDAESLVDQVLGNVVRNIHDFLNHGAAVFKAGVFLFVIRREHRAEEREREQTGKNFFHSNSPFYKSLWPVTIKPNGGRKLRGVAGGGDAPCEYSRKPRGRKRPSTFDYTFSPWGLPREELCGEKLETVERSRFGC